MNPLLVRLPKLRDLLEASKKQNICHFCLTKKKAILNIYSKIWNRIKDLIENGFFKENLKRKSQKALLVY